MGGDVPRHCSGTLTNCLAVSLGEIDDAVLLVSHPRRWSPEHLASYYNGHMSEVTQLLVDIVEVDEHATAELLPVVYEVLRRIARARMANQGADHSLTNPTLLTGFHQLLGTPAYMSLEQAQPSSDISLGVLLYERLTGSTPFNGKQFQAAPLSEMQRIVREVEPPSPSARACTLAADAQGG